MNRPTVLRGVALPGSGRVVDVRLAAGRVAAIADDGTPLARTGDEVLHWPGAYLVPGLVDGHVHWTQWAGSRRRIDVAAATSARQVAETLAAGVTRPAPGEVVLAQGFRAALWPDQPHKDLLQGALPGVAVAVVSLDMHTVWLSPAALARIGWDHPTGVLREQDAFQVQRILTQEQSPALLDQWVAEASAAAAARGITEILDFEFADNVADWRRRAAAGRLGVRVRASVWKPWLDEAIADGLRTGDVVPDTEGLLRVGPFKIVADGSLNTRTAFCHHPYPDVTDPADRHGLLLVEPAELKELVARAARHGLEPAVHAIGDRANAIVLDAFDAVGGPGRVEHAQLVDTADLARFARPGLVASVQPQHALADRDVADRHWAAATDRAFPFRALVAAGARLHLGSDAPVAEPDPWLAVGAAVRRTDDERPPWHPEQSIPQAAALAGAAAGRAAVAVGDPADVVLTAADPLRCPVTDVHDMPVLATFCAGVRTYPS